MTTPDQPIQPMLASIDLDGVPLATAAVGALADARIFVVDDLQANVDVLTRLLRAAGVGAVIGYTNPQEALADFWQLRPDLVLLDLHMPGLDGVGFLERLTQLSTSDEFFPVIVLTADITEEARRQALSAGAKDFLTKPFDGVEVILRVRNLLETRALYEQMRRHNETLQADLTAQVALAEQEAREREERVTRVRAAMSPAVLQMTYQPIVSVRDLTIVGAEALARFDCSPTRPPNEWFEEARSVGEHTLLELAAVQQALIGLDQLPPGAYLSINLSPDTILTDEARWILEDVPAERIVVEITEHHAVNNYRELKEALAPFVARGGRIAVDDAGVGYAGLQHILRLHPDVIKLDRALIMGIDQDPARQSLVTGLVHFAHDINARLIAEGVESPMEFVALRALGVEWVQGYCLARPGPLPLKIALTAGGPAVD